MDIEKARTAALNVCLRDEYESLAKDAEATFREKPCGRSTITVPNAWLPEIAERARREVDKLDEIISKL